MPAVKKKTVFEVKAKERKLIVLPDQGAPVKISTQQLDLQSRNKSWNPFIESFMRANGEYLKSLAVEVSFSTSADAVEIGLQANGVVGAVPLRAPTTHKVIGGLIVKPRYGWEAAGFQMHELFEMWVETLARAMGEEFWRPCDVLAQIREDHRHDIHQVLAYASMYQTRVDALL